MGENLAGKQTDWDPNPQQVTPNYIAFETDGSIRLDPTSLTSDRSTWLIKRYAVTPGTKIHAKAHIRAASWPAAVPQGDFSWTIGGGRIGIDFYSQGKVVRDITPLNATGDGSVYVEWGKEGDQTLDAVVQSGEDEVILWIQVRPPYSDNASAWFSNMEFYIGDISAPQGSGLAVVGVVAALSILGLVAFALSRGGKRG